MIRHLRVHDARPAEEIAAEPAATQPLADAGDGRTPPDPDAVLEAFVAAVGDSWLSARREYIGSPGPAGAELAVPVSVLLSC